MGVPSRYNFKFLNENDSIEPNYNELYYTNFCELYDRASNIFEFENLPKTIPFERLIKQLLLFGRTFIIEKEGDLLAVPGNNGGYLDLYHRPMTAILNNPYAQGIDGEYQIIYDDMLSTHNIYDENIRSFPICCRLKNDKSEVGLYPILKKYAYLLTHAEITLATSCIQSRAMGIASGVGEKAQKELQIFYENLLKGKIYTLKENPIDENTYKVLPFINLTANQVSQFIELKQFYFNEFLNEIGIVTNFNKKVAQQNNLELEINDKIAFSLVDEMFNTLSADLEIINKTFGCNISLKKNYERQEEKTEETEETTEKEKPEEVTEDKESEGDEDEDKV